ncbi:MAG: SMC-Scp complex subunit ScpB [bacterium]|nr:SMC-Scp complex subunit ScpB [bacterium]
MLRALVEAVLLTAGQPVAVGAIADAIDSHGDERPKEEDILACLEDLRSMWDRPQSGLRIEQVANGWRSTTPPQLDSYLRAFFGVQARQRLSQAALEVLAIVAHRQPVTLPEVNFIRGTNSSGVMRTLLDRKLLRLAGRKKVIGKPFLYRTTRDFLVHFGLDRAEDLPDPEELVKAEDDTLPSEEQAELETIALVQTDSI